MQTCLEECGTYNLTQWAIVICHHMNISRLIYKSKLDTMHAWGWQMIRFEVHNIIIKHICDQICQKGLIHAIFKTHFSSQFDSYTNGPTAHVFNTAKSWSACSHSDFFLKPVWHQRMFGRPSNGTFFPWQGDSQL